MSERIWILDATRGAAILLVVFGHAIQSANAMSPDDPILKVLMTFWMPLFFLISGYASGYGVYRGFGNGFRSIFLRLGLPYLVWAEIVYLISVLFLGADASIGGNCRALLKSGFWFLRILFEVKLMFLVYQAVAHIWKGWVRSEVLPVLAAIAVGVILFLLVERSLFHYAPLFALGYAFKRCRSGISVKMINAAQFACTVCFCFGILVMNVASESSNVCYVMDKLMAIFGSVTVVAIVGLLHGQGPVNRALLLLGKWSLAIYAVHWCLLFKPDLLHLRSYVSAGLNLYVVGFVGCFIWLVLTGVFIMCVNRIWGMPMVLFGQKKAS